MGKRINPICCFLFVICLLCGCGDGGKTDASGNASIHSEWLFAESTINGNTINVENDSFEMKLFTADAYPEFSCPKGDRCDFSNNKKTHRGVVTEEGGNRYRIHFNDGYKDLLAEISGDRMTMKNESGTVTLIFKVKKQ